MSSSADVPARPIFAPNGIYCTGEEALRISSLSGDSDAAIRISGRFIDRASGRIVPIFERHVPNTDRTVATSDFTLQEGWLEAITIIAEAGSPGYGQTYARVDLIRGGRGGGATVLQTLLAGPVTANTRRAWPGSSFLSSIDGLGFLRSVTGTDPAAGVEISETVPAGARWLLRAWRSLLVTDANVANRVTDLVIDDGTTEIWRRACVSSLTASSSWNLVASTDGGPASNSSNVIYIPLAPNLLLPAGYRIRTVTTNKQAGDNYGAPQMFVEEFLEAQ